MDPDMHPFWKGMVSPCCFHYTYHCDDVRGQPSQAAAEEVRVKRGGLVKTGKYMELSMLLIHFMPPE